MKVKKKSEDWENWEEKEKIWVDVKISELVKWKEKVNSLDFENLEEGKKPEDWENWEEKVNTFELEKASDFEKYFEFVNSSVGSWMHFPFSIWNPSMHSLHSR